MQRSIIARPANGRIMLCPYFIYPQESGEEVLGMDEMVLQTNFATVNSPRKGGPYKRGSMVYTRLGYQQMNGVTAAKYHRVSDVQAARKKKDRGYGIHKFDIMCYENSILGVIKPEAASRLKYYIGESKISKIQMDFKTEITPASGKIIMLINRKPVDNAGISMPARQHGDGLFEAEIINTGEDQFPGYDFSLPVGTKVLTVRHVGGYAVPDAQRTNEDQVVVIGSGKSIVAYEKDGEWFPTPGRVMLSSISPMGNAQVDQEGNTYFVDRSGVHVPLSAAPPPLYGFILGCPDAYKEDETRFKDNQIWIISKFFANRSVSHPVGVEYMEIPGTGKYILFALNRSLEAQVTGTEVYSELFPDRIYAPDRMFDLNQGDSKA